MDVSVINGLKTWSEFGSCHDRDNFPSKISSSRWTCLWQMDRKPGQIFDHVTIVTISAPKSRAQDGRVCGKWAENLVRIWIMSGSVTRILGPKVRAQNGATCPKWTKKLVNFWICHDRDTSFRTKNSTSKWRYLP